MRAKELFNDLSPEVRNFSHCRTLPSYAYSSAEMPDHDLWVPTGGKASISLNGKNIELKKGVVILLRPGDRYDFKGASNSEYQQFYMHFDPVHGKGPARDYFRKFPRRSFEVGLPDADYFIRILERLYRSCRGDSQSSRLMARGVCTEILAFLMEISSGKGKAAAYFPRKDEFEGVLMHIERKYRSQVSLGELAKIANLSPVYFGKVFKRMTGCSPIQYLIRLRIERAKSLLLHSRLPLKAVAEESGFTSIHYFTFIFSRHEKTSPGEYRRNNSPF